MKARKLISSALATIMTVCSISAINCNAISYDYLSTTIDSPLYKEQIESFESAYVHLTGLEETMNIIIPEFNNISNVWAAKMYLSDSQWQTYMIEDILRDSCNFTLENPTIDAETIVKELEETLGYTDKIMNIRTEYNEKAKIMILEIIFTENDHEFNGLLSEKAYSVLNEKYSINKSDINFEPHIFRKVRLQSCFPELYGIKYNYSDSVNPDDVINKFNDSLEHDYISDKFKAKFNPSTKKIEFAEGFTQEDKLNCMRYIVENHDARVYEYYEAEALPSFSTKINLTEAEISYLDGDSNCDKKQSIADAVAILQFLGNPDDYPLSELGAFNADSDCNGITADDAVRIQQKDAGIL